MTKVLRFNDVTAEEDYKNAYQMVKTQSDFNGFFCGKCKHRIYSIPNDWNLMGNEHVFCEHCGVDLENSEHIKVMIYKCKTHDDTSRGDKSDDAYFRKREYCWQCGEKIIPEEISMFNSKTIIHSHLSFHHLIECCLKIINTQGHSRHIMKKEFRI